MTPKHAPSSHLWLVLCLALLAAIASMGAPAVAAANWTVMVYVDADNDMEDYGILNVNQMEWAPDSTDVNFVVQMDRIEGYNTSNGDWMTAHRFRIINDPEPDDDEVTGDIVSDPSADPWPTDIGEVNMASPDTLVSFVNWAKTTYPAQHYALIMWDHGDGWRKSGSAMKGVCGDDTSGDIMTTEGLQIALSNIKSVLGKNLDVLAFDACEMSAAEVIYAASGYVNYFAGSELDMPVTGLDYGWLCTELVLYPAISAEELSDSIAWAGSPQMLAMDLTKMGSVASTLSAFANAMMAEQAANPTGILQAEVHTWWEVAKIPIEGFFDDEIDLGRFVEMAATTASVSAIKAAATNLDAALEDATVANYNWSYPSNAYTGMTIYYPFDLAPDPMYKYLSFASHTTWDEFISIAPLGWGYIPDRFEWDASLETAKPVAIYEVSGTRWFHYADDMDIVSFDAVKDGLYYLLTGDWGIHILPFLAVLPPGSSTPIATGEGSMEWTCPATGNYKLVITQSDTEPYVQQYGGFTYYDLEVYHRTFFDVTNATWAFRQIGRCVGAGIVNGYPDGSYQPTQPVTRDQMAAYIARALAGGDANVPEATGAASFTDVGADNWAFKYIEYAKNMGVVQGYDGGYRPSDTVDRAQMAAFIARAKAGSDAGVTTTRVSPHYSDVTPSHWAFRYVEYLAANKLATGFGDHTFRPTSVCTRDAMAVFVSKAFAPIDSGVHF